MRECRWTKKAPYFLMLAAVLSSRQITSEPGFGKGCWTARVWKPSLPGSAGKLTYGSIKSGRIQPNLLWNWKLRGSCLVGLDADHDSAVSIAPLSPPDK